MGTLWLPAAGLLLAAVLLAWVSALPLLPAHEARGQPPDSEERLSLNLVAGLGCSPSAEKAGGAPGRRTGVLSSEAAGDQTTPLALLLHLKPGWDRLSHLGSAGATGRASVRPAPSAGAEPVAHRAPESWSSVPGPAEETWLPRSPETTATSLSRASPGPRRLGVGPGPSELPMTTHAPVSVMLRAFVASEPTGQLFGASPVPPTPAPTSKAPELLAWLKSRHPLSTRARMHSISGVGSVGPEASSPPAWAPGAPEKTVPSAPQGPLVLTSTANALATTEPLPAATLGCSSQDTPSLPHPEDSGSPRDAGASGLGPGPSRPLMSPSTAPASPPSSPPPASPSSPAPARLSLSPSPAPPSPSPQPPLQSPTTPPSPAPPAISPFTTRARTSPDAAGPELALTVSDRLVRVSSLPPAPPPCTATGPASVPRTAQPGPVVPASPVRSHGCVSGPPPAAPSAPVGAALAQRSPPPPPGRAISPQDSGSAFPGPRHATRCVAFTVTNEGFSETLRSAASLEHRLLSENIRGQLQPMYHEAFSSFQGISVLLFRPGSVIVNASLVFGGWAPAPSASEVLWTLYRKVKTAGQMMGNLSLDENSLASDGSYLTDLAQELISIHFTVMRPFLPQLLMPGSAPFVLLGEQILRQVTPVVSEFYKVQPQGRPLMLFSDADQWVGVYIEYKFQTPILTHLQGLASHLAQNIVDPAFQKSSIKANGEKAEFALCEVRLQILDRPFTKALENKTSPESQELRGTLTRWLTAALSPLRTFGQVVVEGFQLDPLTAKVGATFLGAAPAQALLQDCLRQGLRALQEAEGFSVEVVETVVPDRGTPRPEVLNHPGPPLPGYAVVLIVLGLLLGIFILVLALKRRACCRPLGLGDPEPRRGSSRLP